LNNWADSADGQGTVKFSLSALRLTVNLRTSLFPLFQISDCVVVIIKDAAIMRRNGT